MSVLRSQPAASWTTRSSRIKFTVSLLVAVICLVGGLDSLIQHFRSSEPRPYRASSGIILVLCAIVQVRLIASTISENRLRDFFASSALWRLLRYTAIATSAGYAIALLIGPDANLRYALRAWAAICYTGCLWFSMARRSTVPTHLWRQGSWFKQCEIAATCVVVLLVTVEGTMRLQAMLTNDAIGGVAVARRQAFDPGSLHRGGRVNQLGYWDSEFVARAIPGHFRIAALGDSAALSGERHTNCLEQIELLLSDTEIYNFTLPRLGPREYAALLKCDVLTYQPDLVLLFVSIDDDVTEQLPLPGIFDWRGLRICQWGLQTVAAPTSDWHGAAFRETSIDQRPWTEQTQIARFAICRTPIDEKIELRWQRMLSHLSTIVDVCDGRDVSLAMVFVPAAFQVDSALRRRICRRGGYQADHIDLELPQRRLISFASQHNVPALDLLPEFSGAADRVYTDDRNALSTDGQQVVATVVADWIERSFGARINARRKLLLAARTSASPDQPASVPRLSSRRSPQSQTAK